eukprot:TRINITY_DN4198_c0_g1_i2.p1 TRINITY_DN4198_c0_g1~~TRINITY_DN4198_c0_g1_i2.p1  ORF type:complete len:1151 (-),score=166.29 TRINITY_DN4198_c0_g1_i2:5-3457(-)
MKRSHSLFTVLLVLEICSEVLSCGIPLPESQHWALPLNSPGCRWHVSNPWDSSFQVDVSNAEEEISFLTREWMPDFVWVIPEVENVFNPPINSMESEEGLGASASLKVSMSILSQIINGDPNSPPQLETVRFTLFNHSYVPPSRMDDAWPGSDAVATRAVVWSQRFTKDSFSSELNPSTSMLNVEVPRVGVDWRSGKLSIRLRWSRAPNADQWKIIIRNATVSSGVTTRDCASKFFNGNSERVTIPTMPPSPNPVQRDCPHWDASLLSVCDLRHLNAGRIRRSPSGTITFTSGYSFLLSNASLSLLGDDFSHIVVEEGARLVFDETDLDLQLSSIAVHGALVIGSPTCPLNAKVNIRFKGDSSPSLQPAGQFGSNVIAVSSTGSIDIHGAYAGRTWSRLAATSFPGDNIIFVQGDDIFWSEGDELIIATSVYEDFFNDHNEVRRITAVSQVEGSDKIRKIQLDQVLRFPHYAGTEYQTEVGHLTRRIKIDGDPFGHGSAEKLGAHIIVMSPNGRFSGVEFIRMGQRNKMGRYPAHFHLVGDAPSAFVAYSTFRDCYYRCVSIHATHHVELTANVAFNIDGSCFYLEEGVEENNTISFNLVVKVNNIGKPMAGYVQAGEYAESDATTLIPVDRAAAGFYITNAWNTILGNAASGGWAGFSLPALAKPVGFSANVSVSPEQRPTLKFEGNTCHSSGYFFYVDGACIYVGGRLWTDPTTGKLKYHSGRNARSTAKLSADGVLVDEWMLFSNTKVWLSQLGISHWGHRATVLDYEAHDIVRSAQLFGEVWIDNVLVNQLTSNPIRSIPVSQGFQFYDTLVKTIVSNIEFRNFQPQSVVPSADADPRWDNRCVVTMTHSDIYKPQGISLIRNTTFTNVAHSQKLGHTIAETGSSRYFNLLDWDGSFSGTGTRTIIGSSSDGDWWRLNSDCTKESAWNAWVCPAPAGVEISMLNIHVPGLINAETCCEYYSTDPVNMVGFMHRFGRYIRWPSKTVITRNPGVSGAIGDRSGWFLNLNSGSPVEFRIYTVQIPNKTHVLFTISYPAGTTFRIGTRYLYNSYSSDVTLAANLQQVLASDGNKYFFDGQYLWLKVVVQNYFGADQPNPSTRSFERAGAALWATDSGYWYRIEAICPPESIDQTGKWCQPSSTDPPSFLS